MKDNVEKMIAELCPTGVLYCEMGKLAQIGTGKSNGNEAEDNGEYPFFIRSPIVKRKNCYEYDEEAIIIPGEGGVGDIFHYINGKYALHQRVYRIHFTTKDVDTRFMYYYLSANFKVFIQRKAVNATVTSIRKPMIEQFPIPLPPLPIQQEIVRILDTFTNLTAELTDKLNAELTARRKQYEYYRDELLTFGEDVEYKKLGEVVSMKAGKAIKAQDIGEKNELFSIPCYGGNGLRGYVKDANCSGDKVLIGRQGALCGNVCFVSGEFYATEHAVVVSSDNNVDMRFLFHLLLKLNLNQYKTAGAQPGLSVSKLETVKVQIPSIEYQRRVSKVLDLFSRYIDNLEDGLPAEISARQKQYEYYRDKLLQFSV